MEFEHNPRFFQYALLFTIGILPTFGQRHYVRTVSSALKVFEGYGELSSESSPSHPPRPPASSYSVGAVDEFNLTVHVSDAGEVVVGLRDIDRRA